MHESPAVVDSKMGELLGPVEEREPLRVQAFKDVSLRVVGSGGSWVSTGREGGSGRVEEDRELGVQGPGQGSRRTLRRATGLLLGSRDSPHYQHLLIAHSVRLRPGEEKELGSVLPARQQQSRT